jgi:hypothetical protein
MKKAIVFFVVVIFTLMPLFSQEKVDLFGYFESQASGAQVQGDFWLLYSNKLRVDLKSSFFDNVTFAANFDYITYHGKTTWNILEFLPDQAAAEVPAGMEDFYILPFSNRHFLDNAYIKLSFKYFDLTAGKQQISLGTGYVWNPIDVFNIKELFDPTYEQPGHNAIRLDVPLGHTYTFTAFFSPEDNWRNSAKLVQVKGRISHFDYALTAIETVWRYHDYTMFDPVSMSFVELPEKRRLLGASTAGELFGMGVWAEFAYNWMDNSEDFYELVVGTDYTFDFQTYLMVEYYRNTLGKTDHMKYTLNDWMRLLANEQRSIIQDQVYVFAQHPATDLMNIGVSAIYSISDSSAAFVPTLSYSLSDNVEIFGYLNFNIGQEGKVFSKKMGNGGLIRVRVYF